VNWWQILAGGLLVFALLRLTGCSVQPCNPYDDPFIDPNYGCHCHDVNEEQGGES
jgi:hypothetical protein